MSEFHNAFYITCKKHEIEHPKWRKCPKCEKVITYSEEEVYKLIHQAETIGFGNARRYAEEGFQAEQIDIREWFEQNKKLN